jgi:hypothetical protein
MCRDISVSLPVFGGYESIKGEMTVDEQGEAAIPGARFSVLLPPFFMESYFPFFVHDEAYSSANVAKVCDAACRIPFMDSNSY